MTPRFYAPGARAGGAMALPEDEREHLTRVLRLKAGAAIRLFDGKGHEFDAMVEKAGKSEVLVAVGAIRPASAPEPRVAITLVQAVLKGDKMDDVVRDAVMIGVAAIHPVVTARTEVRLATLQRGKRRERWQRIAVSSAKQCGRAVVPEVREPVAFDAVPSWPDASLMLIEPQAGARAVALGDLDLVPPSEATVIVGPEGGWTPEEIAGVAGSVRRVTLHAPTLRADAAALIAVVGLFALWRQF